MGQNQMVMTKMGQRGMVFWAEIWRLRGACCVKSWGMVTSRRKSKFKDPETELVLASLRTKDMIGVWYLGRKVAGVAVKTARQCLILKTSEDKHFILYVIGCWEDFNHRINRIRYYISPKDLLSTSRLGAWIQWKPKLLVLSSNSH